MEAPPPSFVSKARTAFNSAAAKAERVFTDLKSDREEEKQSAKTESDPKEENEVKPQGWRTAHVRKKQEWQNKLKNLRIGKKGVEDQEKVEDSTMAAPFYDKNVFILKAKQEQEAKASDVGNLVESLISVDVNCIPRASIVKQLALAIEAGKRAKTVKDFVASSGSTSIQDTTKKRGDNVFHEKLDMEKIKQEGGVNSPNFEEGIEHQAKKKRLM